MARVLVVEDDELVRSALIRELTAQGHAVRSAGRALQALGDIAHEPPEAVVLDLGLPDVDGADLLRMLRGISDVPVVVATARDGEADIVRLLRAGADDYLVKPFSAQVLFARLDAVLRRAGSAIGGQAYGGQAYEIAELRVDVDRREVTLAGRAVELSRREFDLLAFLAARAGRVVTRRELLAQVWQRAYGDDQTIDVHVSWLRRKLGESAAAPRYLHTVRGVGLRLDRPGADRPGADPSRTG